MEALKTGNNYHLVSKYVTLKNKLRMHYVEAGPQNAPTLLLTHGFLGSWGDWQKTIPALLSNSPIPLRIVAVDWPGFGLSDKPVRNYSLRFFAESLHGFVEALELKKFYLMGHSMGGKLNLVFILLYPGYVRKLILLAPDALSKEGWWTKFAHNSLFKLVANQMINSLGDPYYLKQFLNKLFFDKSSYPTDRELKEKARALRQPGQIKALQSMAASYDRLNMTKEGLHHKLTDIKVPTLLIRGREDKVISQEEIIQLRKTIPNSVAYTLKECGHMPQLEKTEVVNKLVLDFIE